MKKYTIYIIILILVISMFNSCGLFTSSTPNDDESDTESDTVPVETDPAPVETTTAPVETEPVEIIQPPETEPTPTGQSFSASGTIKSESNQLLKLHIDWVAFQSEENEYADLELNVYLDCYALTVGARTNSTLTIDGEKTEFSTDKITNENNSLTSVELHKETIQIHNPVGDDIKSVEIAVSFYFGGSYGGESIGWIETEGVIYFVDDGTPIPEREPESEIVPKPDENITDDLIADETPDETPEDKSEQYEEALAEEETEKDSLTPELPADPFDPVDE